MHSIKQNAIDASWALRNDRTQRLDLEVKADGSYKFAMAPTPRLFDDFLGDVLDDKWDSDKGSDSDAVVATISAATGGVVRLTTGNDTQTTMAVDGVQIDSGLNWIANAGGLVFEARIKMATVTSIAIFVGLTDRQGTLEMPINAVSTSDNLLTTTATDAVGFMFDTFALTDKWLLVGVKSDTDRTAVDTTIAPVLAVYDTLRIEVDSSGNATFFLNGVNMGTMANALAADVALTPVVAAFSRSASERTIDVDYILTQSDRV